MRLARLLAFAAALVIAAPVVAQDLSKTPSGRYVLDPEHTSVVFFVSHFGFSEYSGRFQNLSGELTLDRDAPQNSKVAITLPMSGLSVPNATLQGELLEWMNAGRHPTMTFTTTSIERTGPTTGKISGNLTLNGVTQAVVIDARLYGASESHPFVRRPVVGFRGEGTLDRTKFQVANLAPMIGAEVRFVVNAEFIQAQ